MQPSSSLSCGEQRCVAAPLHDQRTRACAERRDRGKGVVGPWLTAIFGGITLDLRDALPAPEGASINATAAFGGIDILVPKGWRISVRGTPILGGVDDKTDHSEPPAPDAPTLHIDALSVLGGVDVKHDK